MKKKIAYLLAASMLFSSAAPVYGTALDGNMNSQDQEHMEDAENAENKEDIENIPPAEEAETEENSNIETENNTETEEDVQKLQRLKIFRKGALEVEEDSEEAEHTDCQGRTGKYCESGSCFRL